MSTQTYNAEVVAIEDTKKHFKITVADDKTGLFVSFYLRHDVRDKWKIGSSVKVSLETPE